MLNNIFDYLFVCAIIFKFLKDAIIFWISYRLMIRVTNERWKKGEVFSLDHLIVTE